MPPARHCRGWVLLRRATLAITAITLVAASPAHADKLAPDDLARKNEGGYVTGLPLFTSLLPVP